MAENKKMTEVEALTAAIERFNPDADTKDAEIVEKLTHMLAIRSKKRERKADTSRRDANRVLGAKFAEAWAGDTFKNADVCATLGLVTSAGKPNTAKATAIIRAMGWAEVASTDKTKTYRLG